MGIIRVYYLLTNLTLPKLSCLEMGSHCGFNGREHVVRLVTEVMAVLLCSAEETTMQPRVTRLSPDVFRFEYDNAREMPQLLKGQVFSYDKAEYRIVHYHQVFGEQSYCSFLVTAKVT